MSRKRSPPRQRDFNDEIDEPEPEETVSEAVSLASDLVENKIRADIAHFTKDVGCWECQGQADNAIELFIGGEVSDCDKAAIRAMYRGGNHERG